MKGNSGEGMTREGHAPFSGCSVISLVTYLRKSQIEAACNRTFSKISNRKRILMEGFFNLKTPDEVFHIIDGFLPVGEEAITLEEAFGRVLSAALTAPEDLPDFFKSTMDGYAVQAKSTFGATESLPALLEIAGEISMGERGSMAVENGQAVRIPTGGMLPEGADAVVMIEYCSLLDERTLEVSRAISPLENTIGPGDDFRKDAAILPAGKRLRPQDLGVLAGSRVFTSSGFSKTESGHPVHGG